MIECVYMQDSVKMRGSPGGVCKMHNKTTIMLPQRIIYFSLDRHGFNKMSQLSDDAFLAAVDL